MSKFSICLFGSMQVSVDGSPIIKFSTDKQRALFAYLVIEGKKPVRRETIAALFWPDRPESAARQSFRQALYQLRRTFGDCDTIIPHLLKTSDMIQFNPCSDYWLDVEAFDDLVLECQEHHLLGDLLCPHCIGNLHQAINLYQGEILADLSISDSSQFGWWQFNKQEAYRRKVLAVLSQLAYHHLNKGNYSQAADYAQREIEIEPWRESAHRMLMQALFLSGQRAEALRQFDICCYALSKELDIEPSEETTRIYMQIREGSLVLDWTAREGAGDAGS